VNVSVSNLTFDLTPSKDLIDQKVWHAGKRLDYAYRECQKEMDMINRAFYELMFRGDADGAPFAYPIPTYNIHERFDWDNPNNDLLWEMTGKMGTPYFSNFINSDMDPSDARSMCPLGPDEKVLAISAYGRLVYAPIKKFDNNYNYEYEIYSDGKFVRGCFNKWENQELIEVGLANGHSITMSKTHLNFVMRDKAGEVEEITGAELREGLYLPYSLKVFGGDGQTYDDGLHLGETLDIDKWGPNVFAMSEEFRKGLLDGCIKRFYADAPHSHRNIITVPAESHVEKLNMLCATLGRMNRVWECAMDGKQIYLIELYDTVQDNGDDWFVKDDRVWVTIVSINEAPGSVGYCFEVEEGAPVFTVGTTGILTHNCRLRLDKREILKRGGGLFGSAEKTGSIGVCTLNLPRIAYLAKDEDDFFTLLDKYMVLAKDGLETKRVFLQSQIDKGLLPAFVEYVGTLRNNFSTIGLVGMNEMCVNLFGEGIASKMGHDFSVRVLDYMNERIADFQEETGNLYNLEQSPAESCAHRLALLDKAEFGDSIFSQGDQAPYYTNSCHLPVNQVESITQLLDHQDELQTKFSGGSVVHLYLGNSISGDKAKHIVRTVCNNYRIPYLSLSPVYSICPTHKFISGYHETCPHCGEPTEAYQRVTGYIRQISKFNPGKKAEFKDRRQLNV
jgi:hypothetical protein